MTSVCRASFIRDVVADRSRGKSYPKKIHLSEDDPLGALDELAKIISDAPINAHWDSIHLEKKLRSHCTCIIKMCDFTSGAHGGREELVGTSPPLPLGLLLLPSSMFVSFRVIHGNGEPDSSC
ncbi:hypothetical protein LR48_Vigan02g047500 [Vigna angularis]|uniref:Uncharacterized protein n=1 Tax=Phaseolus angularis TaxID=3914 RepID=A0A0L9TUU2_PHAAN|nr:hypothetical protein LR48_Vigan02g047500 [Vigna angularis]